MASICGICSLLCDRPEVQQECSLRDRVLQVYRDLTTNDAYAQNESIYSQSREDHSNKIQIAKSWLANAANIHVAGTLASVESSRAAIRFAELYHASVDGGGVGHSWQVSQSLARKGSYLTTLSEASDISDCLIVLGNDRLLERFPMLPFHLKKRRSGLPVPNGTGLIAKVPPVMLLGSFSNDSISKWQKHFDDVLAIPCSESASPSALLDWDSVNTESQKQNVANEPFEDEHSKSAHHLIQIASQAAYVTVVWSSSALDVGASDLWIDRLARWLEVRNIKQRASMLTLSGFESTFQQACTWLTGFPGRVSHSPDGWRCLSSDASTSAWLSRYSNDADAVFVYIDETGEDLNRSKIDDCRCKVICITPGRQTTRKAKSESWLTFRMLRPGLETSGVMCRTDQVIMANVKSDSAIASSDGSLCSDLLQEMCS